MTTDPETLPSRSHALLVQLGYSVGNLGKSVVWTSFESIMLFYLVSIAGFGPLMGGALLALSLCWDAMFDLSVARFTDARGGARGLAKLVLVGAPLCGVCFWLIFVLQAPMAVAAAIIACRIGYSLCDVGHNTLLIRVASAPGDAARVSGMRLLFSASGVALLALVSGSSLSLADPLAQRQSFASGAMAGGALYMATLAIALIATRGLNSPGQAAAGEGHSRPILRYLGDPSFRRLLLLAVVQAGLVPLFQRALPFYGQAVRGGASWAGPALLTITIAQSVALPGWMAIARRHSPRRIATVSHGVAILAMIGLMVLPIGALGMAMLALFGGALGGMNLAIWALLTEIVQRSGGVGGETTPVGLFLAGLKGSAAMGNLLFAAIVAVGAGGSLLPLSATVVPILGSLIAIGLLIGGRGLWLSQGRGEGQSGGELHQTVSPAA
ncbi:MFS transporter [Sphingomonas sanguinis]|uniref:MFS transporter n=1 Tax=Sphingomonas sanguinis TaxID=33051 RepID=A0ABU5LKL3_9SPHN|nr:MFS transporter [Sphingomonas sanguinis]MDZ7280470.1 MFS transporter [Sphingomonas sanguinis]